MQIRTSLAFRIAPIRVVTIKKTNDNKDKDMGKEKYFFLLVWVQTGDDHYRDSKLLSALQ